MAGTETGRSALHDAIARAARASGLIILLLGSSLAANGGPSASTTARGFSVGTAGTSGGSLDFGLGTGTKQTAATPYSQRPKWAAKLSAEQWEGLRSKTEEKLSAVRQSPGVRQILGSVTWSQRDFRVSGLDVREAEAVIKQLEPAMGRKLEVDWTRGLPTTLPVDGDGTGPTGYDRPSGPGVLPASPENLPPPPPLKPSDLTQMPVGPSDGPPPSEAIGTLPKSAFAGLPATLAGAGREVKWLWWAGQKRPMLRIENGVVLGVDDYAAVRPIDSPQLPATVRQRSAALCGAAAAVCRIQYVDAEGNKETLGTGFHVGNGRVITAWHVVAGLRDGLWLEFEQAMPARSVALAGLDVMRVGERDLARIEVAAVTIEGVPALTLSSVLPVAAALPGRLVAVIGYPAKYSSVQGGASVAAQVEQDFAALFGGTLGEVRVSPGLLRRDSTPETWLSHDASTLEGSSGSPLLDLETMKVIGVQSGGEATTRSVNQATPLVTLSSP